MINFNPFEQFEIKIIANLLNEDWLAFTNLGAILLAITAILSGLLYIIAKSYSYIPNNYQLTIEALYNFIYNIIIEQAKKKGVPFLPHFFTLFILILAFNIAGLLPFTMTASSHIVITFTLSLSYIIAWIIIGIRDLGRQFLYIFYPQNMGPLLPLLSCIEILSFSLRPISLGVRLFANMLAGHILLHILSSSTVYILINFALLALPFLAIMGAIACLEIGIGFLQAYIFVILLAIYLKDSLYSHVSHTNNKNQYAEAKPSPLGGWKTVALFFLIILIAERLIE